MRCLVKFMLAGGLLMAMGSVMADPSEVSLVVQETTGELASSMDDLDVNHCCNPEVVDDTGPNPKILAVQDVKIDTKALEVKESSSLE
ncbi:MAG: hypothetical protein J6Y94_04370, partial [Bacteriovoracaceae bacterium]|nr:hypothetical protein [Bacteriovoracaceae bacterium]